MRPCGSPLLQLVAVCCPDGGDEVSDTGKGLGPLRGSGLHTPAYGDVTRVVRAWTAARFGRSFGGGEHPDSAGLAADGTLRRPRPGHRTAAPVDPTSDTVLGDRGLSRDSSRGPRTERAMARESFAPRRRWLY